MHERDAEAVLLLADSLLSVGKAGEAAELLRGLAAANAEDLRARRLLVRALLEMGDYQAAEPEARALADTAGGNDLPPALFFHAHSLWGCGKTTECKGRVERYAATLAAERAAEGEKPRESGK